MSYRGQRDHEHRCALLIGNSESSLIWYGWCMWDTDYISML